MEAKKRNIRRRAEDSTEVEDDAPAVSARPASGTAAKPSAKPVAKAAAKPASALLSFGAEDDEETGAFVRPAAAKPKRSTAPTGVPFKAQVREGLPERAQPESRTQTPSGGEYTAERLREVRARVCDPEDP